MTKFSLDSTVMDLNISNNGREYTVEWTKPGKPSPSEQQQSVEFQVRGETYIMDYLYLNDGNQLTLKLYAVRSNVYRQTPKLSKAGRESLHQKIPFAISQ